MIFLWILLALTVFFTLLWLFMIMPSRRHHENTDEIKKYKYAHRGLFSHEKNIPENSMAAFSEAVKKGYGFELDVHLTADGQLAVIHDASLLRTAGVDKKISEMTYAEASEYFLEGTEEKIPLFADVLALCDGQVPIIIELKTDSGNAKALVARLLEELSSYSGLYAVESFYPDALIALKKSAPSIMRGQLACNVRRTDRYFSRVSNFALKNLLTNFLTKPDFIAYDYQDIGEISYRLCMALYRPTRFFWIVRDMENFEKLEKIGGSVIFDSFEA